MPAVREVRGTRHDRRRAPAAVHDRLERRHRSLGTARDREVERRALGQARHSGRGSKTETMTDETLQPPKPWYQSTAVQGASTAIGSGLAVVGGVFAGQIAFDPVTFGSALASIIGGFVAIYGRATAVQRIRFRREQRP